MIWLYFGCISQKKILEFDPYYHLQVKIQVVDEDPVQSKNLPIEKEIFWKFSLQATEERKDGSWNYRIHLQCLDQNVDMIAIEPSVAMKEHEGIWMTLRAFPHGEFLQQEGFEQSFGEPCMGEHLDAFFFLLFPNVPSIPTKEPVYRQSRWKSPLGKNQMEHVMKSNWKIVEKNRKKQLFQIGYEGEWSSSGMWWEYDITTNSTIQGNLLLDALGGIPYQNTLSANRDVCYEIRTQKYCQKQDVTYILTFVQ